MAHIKATGIAAHIAVTNGEPTTTTQDIAEVYGKRHDDVLRIVRQRISEAGEWGVRNFTDTPYTNPQNGQTYTVIRMTEKGFHFVVGKFTGAKAVQHQIAYADEFQRMKAELAQPTASLSLAPLNHQQVSSALVMGLNMATYVQSTVARAMLDEPADWAQNRWVLSFIPAKGTSGPVPMMERLALNTLVLPPEDLLELMANITKNSFQAMRAKRDAQNGNTD